ncbi:MAG: hypothetical protein MUO29_13145 [Desulfobacterales bacterium]|jgi:hypothetical protein|nr:hypothetical protein [Desulfobacterales bacterium]
MEEKIWFSKQIFLKMSEAYGLDPRDPHMEELYAYLQNVLPGLKVLEKLDVADVEPRVPLHPVQEESL